MLWRILWTFSSTSVLFKEAAVRRCSTKSVFLKTEMSPRKKKIYWKKNPREARWQSSWGDFGGRCKFPNGFKSAVVESRKILDFYDFHMNREAISDLFSSKNKHQQQTKKQLLCNNLPIQKLFYCGLNRLTWRVNKHMSISLSTNQSNWETEMIKREVPSSSSLKIKNSKTYLFE